MLAEPEQATSSSLLHMVRGEGEREKGRKGVREGERERGRRGTMEKMREDIAVADIFPLQLFFTGGAPSSLPGSGGS